MTVCKNKWLHPEDGFDEMIKGMVFDSKIYEQNTNEDENNTFEIIESFEFPKRYFSNSKKPPSLPLSH